MSKAAELSPDRLYRYALWRDTGVPGAEGTCLFVGLNPSTADEREDDPTIRRCVHFAADWGFARLAMGNAYAYRATRPRVLQEAAEAGVDPVGPLNDEWLQRLAGTAHEVIAAWGASPYLTPARETELVDLLTFAAGGMRCLGQTKALRPKHPLYLRADTRRQPFMQHARAL